MSTSPLADTRLWAILALSLTLTACKDDPELVRQRDEQKAAIAKLEGEQKILLDKVRNLPADRSAEISQLKQQIADHKTTIETTEAEVQQLKTQKAEVEKELSTYQRKYTLR